MSTLSFPENSTIQARNMDKVFFRIFSHILNVYVCIRQESIHNLSALMQFQAALTQNH
jgi:hypothetical protein